MAALPISAIPDTPLEVRATETDPDTVIRPTGYQRAQALCAARFTMDEWSRQTGKSMGCAICTNDDVLQVEDQRRRTLWTLISRSLLQARELSLKVRNLGRAVAEAKKLLLPAAYREYGELEERTFELEFPRGSRVICVSANPDAAAGYTGNVWWDEAGLTKRARELFGTAFGVVSRGGQRFRMTSTPRPGFWNQRFEAAQKPGSPWQTSHLTIYEAIAQGCPQNAEELRAGLNDELRWREDYLCEHVDDDICWLPWELLIAATDPRCRATDALAIPEPERDAPAYGGWDVARWQHLSVAWFAQRIGGLLVTRGLLVMRRMKFQAQIAAVSAACAKFPHFVRLCIDATGMGEMVAEEAQRRIGRIEGVKFGAGVKEVLAGDIRRLIEDRTFRLPDDDAVRNDLHSVHRVALPGGGQRFEGEAEGSHADRFWAAALCIRAALEHSAPCVIEVNL